MLLLFVQEISETDFRFRGNLGEGSVRIKRADIIEAVELVNAATHCELNNFLAHLGREDIHRAGASDFTVLVSFLDFEKRCAVFPI